MRWLAALAIVVLLAGCSSDGLGAGGPERAVGTDPIATGVTKVPPPTTASITNETSTTDQDPTTNPTDPETTEMEDDDHAGACRRLTDFERDEANQSWAVVNDDVMGGRSLGGLSFVGGILVFEGEIDTNGGGFSSLRLPLEPETLVGIDRIELRARPDDRSYMVTFDDDLASRDRRVSHRAPIEFGTAGSWQTVSVAFENLFPAIFGQPIDDLPFRADLANRMGLMISDGRDGPFRLEIDWIDLCPAEAQ